MSLQQNNLLSLFIKLTVHSRYIEKLQRNELIKLYTVYTSTVNRLYIYTSNQFTVFYQCFTSVSIMNFIRERINISYLNYIIEFVIKFLKVFLLLVDHIFIKHNISILFYFTFYTFFFF